MQIMEAVRPRASKKGLETPLELWGFFVAECKRYLHVVLCFSPIGEAFRERLRANPSIVNCCTIDWCVRMLCACALGHSEVARVCQLC